MAKKNKKEGTDLSVPDLLAKETALAREVFELRTTLSMQRKLEKPHLLRAKRKERARVLTLLTQKLQKGMVV